MLKVGMAGGMRYRLKATVSVSCESDCGVRCEVRKDTPWELSGDAGLRKVCVSVEIESIVAPSSAKKGS